MTQTRSIRTRLAKGVLFRLPLIAESFAQFAGAKMVAGITPAPAPHTFTSKRELTQLMRLGYLVPSDGCILEIGSYVGASARYLGVPAMHRRMPLICVDTWNNETMPDGKRDTSSEFSKNTRGLESCIKLVRKQSANLSSEDVPSPVSLAFIDGDHSYVGCSSDWKAICPLIHPQGIVAFHDASSYPGVGRTIGEILATRQWKLAGCTDTLTWLHRGVWSRDRDY
jgi:predicted O-methyltransferase YrrM